MEHTSDKLIKRVLKECNLDELALQVKMTMGLDEIPAARMNLKTENNSTNKNYLIIEVLVSNEKNFLDKLDYDDKTGLFLHNSPTLYDLLLYQGENGEKVTIEVRLVALDNSIANVVDLSTIVTYVDNIIGKFRLKE